MKRTRQLGLLSLACMATLAPGTVHAMEFPLKFDLTLGVAPEPKPPDVGTGFFGFNGAAILPDGSYKFSDLTDVYMDLEFIANPPYSVDRLFLYNYYGDPLYSNFQYLYDPDNLKVVIYDQGSRFYFDGPSTTTYGNVGSLVLLMDPSYITTYYPNAQPPLFLSFQPDNPLLPPGAPVPTPPYNRYGIYAKLASAPVGQDPDLIYNGIYGTVVPGPLPLLGVGGAFAWSRRLRRRVSKLSL